MRPFAPWRRSRRIDKESTLNNLLLAAFVVIILWIVILGLYLVITRKQPDLQAQMKALEEQLDEAARNSGKQ